MKTVIHLDAADIRAAITLWLKEQGKGDTTSVNLKTEASYGPGDRAEGHVVSAEATIKA